MEPVSTTPDDRPGRAFDPTAGFFTAAHARPAELRTLDAARLPPLFRALLVIDGTVTKFLEAFAGEPVSIVRLAQAAGPAGAAAPWLDVDPAAEVLHRTVMLVGGRSDRLFGWAESAIVPARLPERLRRALDETGGGIGQILVAGALETRREGLWYGLGTPAVLPATVAGRTAGPFVTRSYRVLHGGRALMFITERFPLPSTG